MPLNDLLREASEVEDTDCWDQERTATPMRAFAVCLLLWGSRFEKRWRSLTCLTLTARTGRSGAGRTTSPRIRQTCCGALRGGSWSTRRRSKSGRSGGGVTPQSAWIRWWSCGIVQPPRDGPCGVHESFALMRHIRTLHVLRTAFLARLIEHRDLSEAELLVDSLGYWTALSQSGQSGRWSTAAETTSSGGSRYSNSRRTASIPSGIAVRPALAAGSSGSFNTTIPIDRIKRSIPRFQ